MSWLDASRWLAAALGVPASAAALLFAIGVRPATSTKALMPSSVTETVLHVSRTEAPVVLDGILDESVWHDAAASTGVFVASSGEPGRPHSEATIVRSRDVLYVALYAADSDIRASRASADGPRWVDGDAFELTFTTPSGEYRIDVSPDGTTTDARLSPTGWDYGWQGGALIGHDADGTINDSSDDDEEWIVELAIPFASMGIRPEEHGSRVGLRIRRCDSSQGTSRTCTSWGERERSGGLVLD